MNRLWIAIVTAGLLIAADDAKKDNDKMQGTWVPVSIEVGGNKFPEDQLPQFKLTIKGDRMSHPAGAGKVEEMKFTLDPTKKPKTIDMTGVQGSDVGKTSEGIYELNGDTLKLCVNRPGEKRPTEFVSKTDSKIGLIVLKRTKP